MQSNRREQEPLSNVRPVSELPLFPDRPAYWVEIDNFQTTFIRGIMGRRETVLKASDRFVDKANTILDRLQLKRDDVISQARDIVSSTTVGSAYVRMYDELSAEGVLSQDINSFFLTCLEINTQDTMVHEGKTYDEITALALGDQATALRLEPKNSRSRVVSTIPKPAWFHGKDQGWVAFLYEHSYFCYLLHPESFRIAQKDMRGQMIYLAAKDTPTKPTYRSTYPDWVENLASGETKIADVHEELAGDEMEKAQALRQLGTLNRQIDAIEKINCEKSLEADRYLQNLKIEAVKRITSFPELILFLHATDGFIDDPFVFEEYDMTTSQDRNRCLDREFSTSEETRMKVIEGFVDENVYRTELLALWFERKLHESGITNFMKAEPSLEVVDVLLSNPSSRQNLLQELRDKNKRLYNSLRFEMLPFFDVLSQEEKEYLQHFISENPHTSYGSFIMEASEVIALKVLREGAGSKTRDLDKKEVELKRFSKNIINNNFSWFRELLVREQQERVHKNGNNGQPQEELPSAEQVSYGLDLGGEALQRELEQDNLKGWKMYYARKMQVDPDHLDILGGDTLAEREASLSDYLASQGISFPIKLSSILNALEGFARTEGERLKKWPKKTINGERFYKIKRGKRGRAFAQIDHGNKELRFFLFGKTDYYYHF